MQSGRVIWVLKTMLWAGLSNLVGYLSTCQAQTPVSLSELVDRATKFNYGVRINQTNTRLGSERFKEARAGILPQVGVQGDYKYYAQIPTQVTPASVFGNPNGGYLGAQFGLPWNLSTTIQINQLLYSAQVGYGLKMIRVADEVDRFNVVRSQEDAVYQVSNAFYTAQSLARQMQFVRGNIQSMEQLISKTDLLRQNQMAKGSDVERLRLNKTNLEVQLASIQTSYDQLVNLIKFLTATPQDQPLELDTTIREEEIVLTEATYDLGLRSEWQLLNRQKLLNALEQKNIQAAFVPTFAAYGILNTTAFGIGARNGEASYLKSFPASWFGIQINWSAFDGFKRRAQLAQKRIESDRIDWQLTQAKENISMEVANARQNLATQQQTYKTARQQITFAQTVYDQTQLQFREGMIGITDVTQAQNTLREAQTNYLTAYIKLRQTSLDLSKAAGTLLTQTN